jgi:pullulanase/glycogen debranching enzyme
LELWFFARNLPKAFKDKENVSWQSIRAALGDPLWYKDAVIYELHVRAFKDSNGDGIGDFPGLIQKLDYLQDLGGDMKQ